MARLNYLSKNTSHESLGMIMLFSLSYSWFSPSLISSNLWLIKASLCYWPLMRTLITLFFSCSWLLVLLATYESRYGQICLPLVLVNTISYLATSYLKFLHCERTTMNWYQLSGKNVEWLRIYGWNYHSSCLLLLIKRMHIECHFSIFFFLLLGTYA
jgi:hypothetical protein